MSRTLFTVVLLATSAICARSGPARGAGPGWGPPRCTGVVGPPAITFTRDWGVTTAPNDEALAENDSGGVLALDEPNALVGWVTGHLGGVTAWRSRDAGCHWSKLGDIVSTRIASAPGGLAYVWSPDEQARVQVIEPSGIRALSPVPTRVVGLAADPADSRHLRAIGNYADIWDSRDRGKTWAKTVASVRIRSTFDADAGTSWVVEPQGAPGDLPMLVQGASFSPRNLDHVVVTSSITGAFASRDGGRTWVFSRGFLPLARPGFGRTVLPGRLPTSSVLSVAFASDGRVVWAIQRARDGYDTGPTRDLLFRSDDGGFTFSIRSPPGQSLGPGSLVVHPNDPDQVLLPSHASMGALVRYDNKTGRFSEQPWRRAGVFRESAAFSPGDPSTVYLGLSRPGPID